MEVDCSQSYDVGTCRIRLPVSQLSGVAVRLALLVGMTGDDMGIMITASDLEESYNGILLDTSHPQREAPRAAIVLALTDPHEALAWYLKHYDSRDQGNIHVGRDARESSESLAQLVVETATAAGACVTDHGEITTPCLRFCKNNSSVRDDVTPDSYYSRMAKAYAELMASSAQPPPTNSLLVRTRLNEIGKSPFLNLIQSNSYKKGGLCGRDWILGLATGGTPDSTKFLYATYSDYQPDWITSQCIMRGSLRSSGNSTTSDLVQYAPDWQGNLRGVVGGRR